MRPTWRVHLSSGDAQRTQYGHRKRAFFATTPDGGFHTGQRSQGAGVRWLVGYMLMAPVVQFKYGLGHAQALYAFFQFVVQNHARVVQVFIVHTYGKYEMPEQQFGNVSPPRHFVARLERGFHVIQVETGGVIGDIGHGHIGIQKLQSLLFGRCRHGLGWRKEVLTHQLHFRGEVFMHFCTVFVIRNEMVKSSLGNVTCGQSDKE